MLKFDSLSLILASTLLVSVVALVGCENIENNCDKLDKYLSKKLPDELDATKNYEVAPKVSIMHPGRSKAAKEWRLVREAVASQTCSDEAIKTWLSFGECFLDQKRLTAVLRPDLIRFTEVCEEGILNFLSEKQRKSESSVYSGVRKPLLEFLSDNFIRRYLDANSNEPNVHLGRSETGIACCMPDNSIPFAIDSLQKIVQQAEQKEHKTEIDEKTALKKLADPDKVSELLKQYLFVTCETYRQMMHVELYGALIRMSRIAPILIRTAIDGSNEFKFSVFRYRFCNNLKSEKLMRGFADKVMDQIRETSR